MADKGNITKITLPNGDVVHLKDNVSGFATTTYVDNSIAALPEPMLFKGSVGTDGTVTWANLPAAAASNEGFTYKVITAHSAETGKPAAKVGDTIISTGSEWVVIPSGDEPSGTVTSITIKATSPIAVDSTSAITTSGTRTISHANSGATAGSYGDSSAQTPAYGGTFKVPYVTVNATGHVTGISEHTVKIPASDNTNYYHKTGSWSGLTYTAAKVGSPDDLAFTIPTGTTATTVALGNHTHTTSIATSSGTNQITLALGSKYAITAGGTSYVFTMPSNPNTDYRQRVTLATTSKAYITGVTTAPTSSNQDLTAVGDTGVYLTTTAGQMNATSYKVNEAVVLQYNSTTKSLDFVFL